RISLSQNWFPLLRDMLSVRLAPRVRFLRERAAQQEAADCYQASSATSGAKGQKRFHRKNGAVPSEPHGSDPETQRQLSVRCPLTKYVLHPALSSRQVELQQQVVLQLPA